MKDMFITYRFVKPGTDITFVNFTAVNNYGSVAAVVEMLHNTSTLISAAPPGTVYKNINLWVGSAGFATNANMENVTISFSVNRSWIDGNSVSIPEIRLHGYNKSDKTWMLLPIEITGKDESHIHFESKTAIFNQLAITCPAPVSNSMSAPAPASSRFGASAHVPEESCPHHTTQHRREGRMRLHLRHLPAVHRYRARASHLLRRRLALLRCLPGRCGRGSGFASVTTPLRHVDQYSDCDPVLYVPDLPGTAAIVRFTACV